MALTPEDVINKRFQPTKFREGYDQDEVDDFLDEIVVELRRLNQENADLREQNPSAGTAGTTAAATSTSPAADGAPTGATAADAQGAAATEAAPATGASAAASSGQAPSEQAATETVASATPATASPAGPDSTAQSAAGVLAMAQKLHDQYVAEGRTERERLIAEGRAQADTLVTQAQTDKAQVLESLHSEKRGLEATVSGLRNFETSYRDRLTEFIGAQLREIKTAPELAPESAAPQDGQRA